MRFSVLAISSLLVVAIFCSFSHKKKTRVYTAPGVVQIDTHLFMDRTEVTNFHWKEYEFWVKKVYGENSAEYKAVLPDQTLWKNEVESHQDNEQFYYDHAAYRGYPVVGLSYKQIVNYCAWRSDRVFEYLLINEDMLELDTNQTADHHFTIENYLNGKFGNYKTGQTTPPIPHYYLPTEDEWNKADKYALTVYANMTKRQLKHSPAVYYSNANSNEPTFPVMPSKKYGVKGALYNMHSNVSEQLSDSTKVAGENWKGSASLTEGDVISNQLTPSTSVGFRCAFRWK
jgi:formylglycine-generating enzyme required for sulfatase activity